MSKVTKKITLEELFSDFKRSDINSLLGSCKTTAYVLKGKDQELKTRKVCPFLIVLYDEPMAIKMAGTGKNSKVYRLDPLQDRHRSLSKSFDIKQIYPN